MRATTSIDPRLIAMLGRKMYSSNPLVILARELLQNSVDACRRKGVDPDVRIIVREREDRRYEITCMDNGIGMTQEQIVNDFLCLGGKKDAQNGQTGGFGIAKAAIMSGESWSVRSLDNFLNQDMLIEGREIRKMSQTLHGTIVQVVIDAGFLGYTDEIRFLSVIYLSDVSVKFKWVSRHGVVKALDRKAGIDTLLGETEMRDLEDVTTFFCRATPELPIKVGTFDRKFRGLNVIRLNGLVQFIGGNLWGEGRQTNLVFDLKVNGYGPEDELYPLTMSREGLTEVIKDTVKALVQTHDANVLQSQIIAEGKKPDKEHIQIRPGSLVQGERQKVYESSDESSSMGSLAATELEVEYQGGHGAAPTKNVSGMPRLLIRRYEDKDPAYHAKLLRVWTEVVRIVAHADEEFGIGITSDNWVHAERAQIDSVIYYTLNPIAVNKELSPEGVVERLWALAAHEATHRYVRNHDEKFSSTLDDIMAETSDAIYSSIKRIARLLK